MSKQKRTEVDMHSLHALTDILSKIEDDGGCIDHRLWDNGLQSRLKKAKPSDNDDGLFYDAKTTLRKFKGMSDLLSTLSESLHRNVSVLESQIKPYVLYHGISRLSDDILSFIFELAHEVDPNSSTHLSMVNRRFRNLAIGSPRLWSKIPLWEASLNKVELQLQRSKKAPLDVNVYLWRPDELYLDGIEVLSAVIPHSDRIQSLSMYMETPPDWMEAFTMLDALCSALQLPKLECLSITYPMFLLDSVEDDEYAYMIHFYSTWNMPNLRTFSIYHLTPRPFNAPLLTTVILHLTGQRADIYDETRQALQFLAAFPMLSGLKLAYGRNVPLGSLLAELPRVELPCLELPLLEKFTLVASDLEPSSLEPITNALAFPNIRNITSVIGIDSHSSQTEIDQWLKCILPSHNTYMHLENFTFKIQPEDLKLYTLPYDKLPNLRHLFLATPGAVPIEMGFGPSGKLPALKTVELRGVDGITGFGLKRFRTALEEQGHWEGLEKVTLVGCRELEKDIAEIAISKERLEWVPYWNRYITNV
ncbi:hypothetical protein DFH11DRAFT_1640177 [Phellopilus nigrolimitatus]|nr:hypothetical protein DFH11DRAFT_1640177 [Phellopilus nigrolimitatus]